jgi:hypothetical protein
MPVPNEEEFRIQARRNQERIVQMGFTEEEAIAHFQEYEVPTDIEFVE